MTEQNRMEHIIRVTADIAYVKSCIRNSSCSEADCKADCRKSLSNHVE
ncbi:MAG: hypothetical protein UHU19_16470 [Lachnospiraceae bacterium]|nr:hypothetical protein [Lachnospiraceae bacterium]